MTLRLLDPSEYAALVGHEGLPDGVPDPDHSRIVVGEYGGKIVAFWVLVEVIHIEPVWIAPQWRSTSLVRGLWRAVRSLIDGCGISSAFCFSDRPDTADYLTRLGLTEMPYRTFRYDAPKDTPCPQQ